MTLAQYLREAKARAEKRDAWKDRAEIKVKRAFELQDERDAWRESYEALKNQFGGRCKDIEDLRAKLAVATVGLRQMFDSLDCDDYRRQTLMILRRDLSLDINWEPMK
jgi:hypothetical protein